MSYMPHICNLRRWVLHYSRAVILQIPQDLIYTGVEPGDELRAILGHNVATLRNKLGIKKSTFAAMCGISRPFLDTIERGEANVRLSVLQTLADALAVDPIELITLRNSPRDDSPSS